MSSPGHPAPGDTDALPFVAPCRALALGDPLKWLRLGWRDLRAAPGPSLAYGLALTLLSFLIVGLTWHYGLLALYLGLATGFVFVGPVLAVGLYSISRQIEAGRPPRLGYCLREGWQHLKEVLVVGVVLLVVMLVWARAASMVHVFFPIESQPEWHEVALFLSVGSAVGAVFAAVIFSASAFSLPMIMDRRADAITAAVTSVNAVLRNKGPALVWAAVIGCCVVLGFATALIGFIVLLPLIGHATWHAYRATIDASAWPVHGVPSD